MVARIIKGKDITGLVKYNDKPKSRVLYSQYINDFKDPAELTRKDKIEALQAYIRLNPAIAKPTFHVSINPDPRDQLSDALLQAIGREYMAGMNYGQQPYLIYKHEDIDRVHIHIVSVNIGLDGKVINSSNERYRSEAIRKHLEVKYHLVKATDKGKESRPVIGPIDVAAIVYGKTDTKSAISRVVRFAAREYTFPSLEEFRSLLHYYHVTVDEVKNGVDPVKTIGLLYSVVNPQGEKVSARIKASAIDRGVGYEALLQKFAQGKEEIAARNLIPDINARVAAILDSGPRLSQQELKGHLIRQRLQVLAHKDKASGGFTFIDTSTRTLLNHKALGPAFPLRSLQALFSSFV